MTTIEEAFEKYWSSLADAPNDSPQVVASCKWAAYHAWHAAIEHYAAEQIAEARKPLTEEQIDAAIAAEVDPVATYRRLHNFARAIERAHGIREQQKNSQPH